MCVSLTEASYSRSGFDLFCGILLLYALGREEKSQREEVDELYDADETEANEEAANASKVA
jgi:hypothetical protein